MIFGFGKKKEEKQPAKVIDYSKRYDRQKALEEIGEAGQEKLKNARVLIVGCGDRGIAAAMYLAAAGIGTIGLADNKEIEVTDIQRQPIYFNSDIGKKKVYVLADRLKEINPDINVVPNKVRFRHDNIINMLTKYDVILDCTDNYPSHYLLNDACVLNHKPLVFATAMKFDCQATVFYATKGPCYRCFYKEPPNPSTVKETSEVGIFGPIAGLAGLIQAAETIKLITGTGEPLIGRLISFSANDMRFSEIQTIKNEDCKICGKNPKITQLIDYDEYCGVKAKPEPASIVLAEMEAKDSTQMQQLQTQHINTSNNSSDALYVSTTSAVSVPLLQQKVESKSMEISPKDVKQKLDNGEKITIIDVRESYERDIANIQGSIFIPLDELPDKMTNLNKNEFIVVYCHHGMRSAFAAEMMRNAGFTNVYAIAGGIDEWSSQVDSKVPRYM